MLRMQKDELMRLVQASFVRQEEAIISWLTSHSRRKRFPSHCSDSAPVKMKDRETMTSNQDSQSSRGVQSMTIGRETVTSNEDSQNSRGVQSMTIGRGETHEAKESKKIEKRKRGRRFSSKTERLAWTWSRPCEGSEQQDESELNAIWNELKGSCVKNHRKVFDMILNSHAYDAVMFVVIIGNCGLIIADTDAGAGCNRETGCTPDWIWYANLALLLIYTLEGIVVLDTYRLAVLKNRSRLLELFIVLFFYIDLFLAKILEDAFVDVQFVKLIRLTRLMRPARLISVCPELERLVQGLFGAMRAMLWGFGLLMMFLVATSIVAVEVLHDLNQKFHQDTGYCEEVFDSVWNSTILFFQIVVAGDSWGLCTITLMKSHPSVFLLFGGVLVAMQVGFLNLVMSVILDHVAESREKDKERRLQIAELEVQKSRQEWLDIFGTLDADGNGELSIEELVTGFESSPTFRQDCKLLGIEKGDLPSILQLMDQDRSGQISKKELFKVLDMLWNFNHKTHSVIMSMRLRDSFERLDKRLTHMEDLIVTRDLCS